ncbi:MAG: hypothetical protein ACJ758_02750 [Actinomycetota bacterium]
MKRAIGVLGVAMAVAVATPAFAVTNTDPDDVPGPLDMAQVSRTFTNGPDAPPMVHLQVTTYDPWTLAECNDADACSFTFELNALDVNWATHAGPGSGIRQTCLIFRNETVIAHGVSTKYHRSVFCSFRKELLRGTPVRWRVLSLWGTTVDKAPDSGRY